MASGNMGAAAALKGALRARKRRKTTPSEEKYPRLDVACSAVHQAYVPIPSDSQAAKLGTQMWQCIVAFLEPESVVCLTLTGRVWVIDLSCPLPNPQPPTPCCLSQHSSCKVRQWKTNCFGGEFVFRPISCHRSNKWHKTHLIAGSDTHTCEPTGGKQRTT